MTNLEQAMETLRRCGWYNNDIECGSCGSTITYCNGNYPYCVGHMARDTWKKININLIKDLEK